MSRKNKHPTPALSEVKDLLAVPKGLVSNMEWARRPDKDNPVVYRWFSAVNLEDGEIMEDVRVLCEWNDAPHEYLSESYQFGFYIPGHRLFAYDFGDVRHQNHRGYGEDKPYGLQLINGPHVHHWTTKGYNYAEPLSQTLIEASMEDQWYDFCSAANIINNITFSDPKFDAISGQGNLL